ncbi:hypothetical protein [Flindersiella endophytica]
MSTTGRLTGTLAGGGALLVGFLTGRWIAAKVRGNTGYGDADTGATAATVAAAH